MTTNVLLSAPFESSGWHRFRDIHVSPQTEAGPVTAPLESAILERSRPDLADLRVITSEGQMVPIAVTDPLHRDEPAPFPAALFKIVKRPGKWTDVWIDKKAKILTRGVTLQTNARDFAHRVEIRGSDTGTETYVILMNGLVCDLTGSIPVRSLELSHPLNNFRYLQLRILDEEQAPLKVDGALCFPAAGGASSTLSVDVRIAEHRLNASDSSTLVIADLGEKRFPFSGIKIATPTKAFIKKVRILQGSSDTPDSWRVCHEGVFFRIERAGAAKEKVDALFDPQTARYVMLELTGEGPVVTVKAVEARQTLRFVVFSYRPGTTYRLFYDNPHATALAKDASLSSVNLNRILAGASEVILGNEQKHAAQRPQPPVESATTDSPTTVGKLLGMAMLLIGLLLLFAVMLRARSQRRAERGRRTRLLDTRM